MKIFLAILSAALSILPAAYGQADIPTLVPAVPFNPTADAQTLRDAMAGVGTNDQKIIDVQCRRVAVQRDNITRTYGTQFGRNLVSDFRSEMSGAFLTLMEMTAYRMTEFLAIELHDTIAGAGTDEPSLTEVLISRLNAELAGIRSDYLARYGVALTDAIRGDLSGSVRDLLVAIAEGRRSESTVIDNALVQSDTTNLYNAGAGMPGTDEAVYVQVFSQRSYPHLNAVSAEYKRRFVNSLETDILTEFSGDIQSALLSILDYAASKATYMSRRLKDSTFGAGTKDRNLARQVLSRCETDLGNIKTQYQTMYGSTLASDVSSDTSGSFRTALLTLIG